MKTPRPPDRPRRRRHGGPADRTRVLLLHGLGCRTSMWDRFAELVGDRFELWDVELPWHGIEDTRWSHSEDNVRQLVRAVGGESGDIDFDAVLAHSFSANLLLEAYVDGLIRPRPSVLVSPFYQPTPDGFDWRTISHYLNDFHLIFAEGIRLGDGRRHPPEDRNMLARRLRNQLGPYGWTRFFAAYLRSPFLDLAGVLAPQLVVIGDTDIAAPREGALTLAKSLPYAEYELLEKCGHFPMLEWPEQFTSAVSEFLNTVPRRIGGAATDDSFLELA